MRAGIQALSLLSVPLNVEVLRAIEEGPCSLLDLRRDVGFPSQTTMRSYMQSLVEQGIVERSRQRDFPGAVSCRLGIAGRELLEVAEVLSGWLTEAPAGPIPLGSSAAKGATKALVEGWSTNVVRVLAARPASLTELSRLLPGVGYPSLERRLTAMRLAGQLEDAPGSGGKRGRPVTVTDWLRAAVRPLAAAAEWELRRREARTAPVAPLDVEAAFLLTVPSLRLGEGLSGRCRLTVEVSREREPHLAGVMTEARGGEVVSCVTRLEGEATGWATGSPEAWLRAVRTGEPSRLELGGDGRLASAYVEALHDRFVAPGRARTATGTGAGVTASAPIP